MRIEIGITLTPEQINECQHIASLTSYKIYTSEQHDSYIFALDTTGKICSCFEFVEAEEGWQLAHMHTLDGHKGIGLGKTIMREAVKMFGQFELPSTNPDDNYYFVEDGLGFTLSCFHSGILTAPPFKRPHGTERPDDY